MEKTFRLTMLDQEDEYINYASDEIFAQVKDPDIVAQAPEKITVTVAQAPGD